MTYFNGDIIIALHEVLARNLQFHNGIHSELPDSIKLILDNLQFSFIKNHRDVFLQTLRALKMHATMLTLFQKNPLLQNMTLFQKMRLLEAILLTIQILQMIPTLANSLAKRISIQRIK